MSSKEIKILHCADLHLGFEFSSLGDKAAQRKRENFLAFERIISLCQKEEVDFLLIAGDLFDHLHIEAQIITELVEQINRIPGTVIAITPGNHDPFTIDSCYYTRSWPENVVIFSNEMSCIIYEEKNVCLWGAGFNSTYHQDSFFNNNQNDIDENMINICVIHGDLVPQGQNSMYNPMSKDSLRLSRFDYVAMGHVHKRTEIQKEGKTFFAYSGCPESHGFDELGDLGVYLGNISKGRNSLQFLKTCNRCYYEIPVEVSNIQTNQDIAELILQKLNDSFFDDARNHLYKIVLQGEVPIKFTIDPEGISQKISPYCYFSKIEDQTIIEIDYDSLAKEQTLKGIFVRKIYEKLEDAKSKKDEALVRTLHEALKYGLKAFDGEVVFNEN